MLDYTKTAVNIILEDLRKFAKIVKTISLVFTTGYFIFVLVMRSGILIANIVLASLFFIYTIFELIATKKDIKKIRKIVKKSFHWIKLSIKFLTLLAMIYGIYTATTGISDLSIIFVTLVIVLWIFQVLLELFIQIFENKMDLFIAGWNKDIEDIKRPITSIKNVFRRVKGEQLPPQPEKSKELLILEKRLEQTQVKKPKRQRKTKKNAVTKVEPIKNKRQKRTSKVKDKPEQSTSKNTNDNETKLLPMKSKK